MPDRILDPYRLDAGEIRRRLIPGAPCLPELEAARRDLDALCRAPATRAMLAQSAGALAGIEAIPALRYSDYRLFGRTGDRTRFETPYFGRRGRLSVATLRLFLGEAGLKDVVQDYIWSICEETNWVSPAHERVEIDLFSAETGFALADTLNLLGDTLDAEVRSRVRGEVERRIFEPYLRFAPLQWWYEGHNNWNGVCNSSVAATFLLLEPETGRTARAVEMALAGLRVFLDTAFERDGSSTEGVSYWHYGLHNFVALSEMLRARTGGAIDLLDSPHLRAVAAYPEKLLLSSSQFAPFSDCDERPEFSPGIISRLMLRTGESSLAGLLAPPTEAGRDRHITAILRNVLWWDGAYHQAAPAGDAYLPRGGVARLAAATAAGARVILAAKAGHNAENHNQNDVGSFVLHVDGETFLADPGHGLYTRQYFGPERYDNVFANSYGHSVPRIGGQLQPAGHEFRGEIVRVETEPPLKRVEIEMARAYPVAGLASLRRRLSLDSASDVELCDTFRFAGDPQGVEEAFVTWLAVEVDGRRAVLHGERHDVRLTIEAPAGATFALERLEEASLANAKPGTLKRLSFDLAAASEMEARVRVEVG